MQPQRICVITGAAGGIGYATAAQLAAQGYRILAVVRPGQRSRQAIAELDRAVPDAQIRPVFADLSSLAQVRAAVDAIGASVGHLDLLINNAGVFKRKLRHSPDGFEMTFAVNYLAPFLLTTGLLPVLSTTPGARVVNVTSALYRQGDPEGPLPPPVDRFSGRAAYATSKRLLVQFTIALAGRLEPAGATANCLHPGVVATDVFREYPRLVARAMNRYLDSPADSARRVVRLATSPELGGVTGSYFERSTREEVASIDREPVVLSRLWRTSEALTAARTR